MLTYIVRRILYSIPVLFFSTFFSFLFVSYAGDPVAQLRQNPRIPKSTLVHLEHQMHLDKPVIERYFLWLQDVFTQKLGKSLVTLQPIWPQITRTMGHTAQFIIISEVIAIVLGVAVGIFSAIRQYSVFDYLFTTVSFLGFAMPTFWLALLLQIAFTDIFLHYNVRIFYTSGLNSLPGGPAWSWDRLQHLALPIMTLSIISFALYSRYMRASMLDVINSDYIRTARAKGVSEWRVVMRHVSHHDGRGSQLRGTARWCDRHGDRLLARRHRLLVRPGTQYPRSLRGDGLPPCHGHLRCRLQPDRGYHVRLPRSAHPV
jgi:peptide/nickel transport system permease protein